MAFSDDMLHNCQSQSGASGLGRIISNETENVDVYDPDLTLKGINLVYTQPGLLAF